MRHRLSGFPIRQWPGFVWYYLVSRARRALGLEPSWRWELCLGCGSFIRCPRCFGNCGFSGELCFGRACPECVRVSAAWHAAKEFGTVPKRPEFEPGYIARRLAARRRQLEAAGVKFATAEDLLAGGFPLPAGEVM